MGGNESREREHWETTVSGARLKREEKFLRLSTSQKDGLCHVLDVALDSVRGKTYHESTIDISRMFTAQTVIDEAISAYLSFSYSSTHVPFRRLVRDLINLRHSGIGGGRDILLRCGIWKDGAVLFRLEKEAENMLESFLSESLQQRLQSRPLSEGDEVIDDGLGNLQEERFAESLFHVHIAIAARIASVFNDSLWTGFSVPKGILVDVPVPQTQGKSMMAETKAVWRSRILSPTDALFLNICLPLKCTSKWELIFSSDIHGMSFSRLQHHVTRVGPSLVVIRDEEGHIFGGYAAESWKKKSKFFGDGSTITRHDEVVDYGFGSLEKRLEDEYHPPPFLFALYPRRRVYRATGVNANFQWLASGTETLPNGLGMGGQENFFGFFLSEGFDKCHSKGVSSTFANPSLCGASSYFRPRTIEVWGCLGEKIKVVQGTSGSSVLDDRETRLVLDLVGRTGASNTVRDRKIELDEEGTEKQGLTGPVGKIHLWDPTAK